MGKTTILEHLMEGSVRKKITLDDVENRRLAKEEPELFLEMHPAPLLIDEVQYAPEMFRCIIFLILRMRSALRYGGASHRKASALTEPPEYHNQRSCCP